MQQNSPGLPSTQGSPIAGHSSVGLLGSGAVHPTELAAGQLKAGAVGGVGGVGEVGLRVGLFVGLPVGCFVGLRVGLLVGLGTGEGGVGEGGLSEGLEAIGMLPTSLSSVKRRVQKARSSSSMT